jgi:hypothetical protein
MEKNYEIPNKKSWKITFFWVIFPEVFGQIYLLEDTSTDSVNSDVF